MEFLTNKQRYILTLIKCGSRANPVSNAYISATVGISSNAVRENISKLRDRGYRVCSDETTTGYWLAKDDADYLQFRKLYMTKVLKRINRLKAMDSACSGQTEFDYGELGL